MSAIHILQDQACSGDYTSLNDGRELPKSVSVVQMVVSVLVDLRPPVTVVSSNKQEQTCGQKSSAPDKYKSPQAYNHAIAEIYEQPL